MIENFGVAYTFLSKETLEKYNFKKGDTEGFVNFRLQIKGISVSVIFIEDINEEIIKISFRSKDNIDVNLFYKNILMGVDTKMLQGASLIIQ